MQKNVILAQFGVHEEGLGMPTLGFVIKELKWRGVEISNGFLL
jgi:hypothetical protein